MEGFFRLQSYGLSINLLIVNLLVYLSSRWYGHWQCL